MREVLPGPYASNCPPLLRDVVIAGFVGFGVVAVAFAGYGILVEVLNPPKIVPGTVIRSYGQEWGLNMFVAGLLGLTAGWSIALSLHRQRLLAVILCFAACAGTAAFARRSWENKITNYGHDASDSIVYGPLLALSAVVFVIVCAVSAVHAVTTRAEVLPSRDTEAAK